MAKKLILPSSSSSRSSVCNVTTNTEKIKNHYIFTKEVMGKGTFGTVRKVKNKGKKNKVKKKKQQQQQQQQVVQYYACKTIPKSKYKDGNLKLIKEEVTNLGLVRNHPHILKLEQAFEDNKKIDIITELLEGGELYDTILEMRQARAFVYFPIVDSAYMIRNILDALRYCHDVAGIVHRDLTASNFMFTKPLSNTPNHQKNNYNTPYYYLQNSTNLRTIKIIDFGLSTKVDPMTGYVSGCVGTPYYVAPEVLTEELYTNKCDVWSMGVVTYLLLSLTLPYQGRDESDTVDLLLDVDNHPPDYQSKRWTDLKNSDPEAISFCQCLLQKDPMMRPTMKEAMHHPWIVKHCGVPLLPDQQQRQQKEDVVEECDRHQQNQQTEMKEHRVVGHCRNEEVVKGMEKDEGSSSSSSSSSLLSPIPLLTPISCTSSQSSSDAAPAVPAPHANNDNNNNSNNNNNHTHQHNRTNSRYSSMESIPEKKKKKKTKKSRNILQRLFVDRGPKSTSKT